MRKFILLVLVACLSVSLHAQKFAYVDSKYILSHVPEYQQAQQEINKLSIQWQKEIEMKYESVARLETSLQAEKVLLTEDMRKQREQEIDQKRQEAKDLQKQRFGVEGDLFKRREELIKPIQDQIYEAIQEVASTSGLMVVFDKANHSNMLYTNPKQDVSDKVLKKMGLKPGDILDDSDKGEEGKDDQPKEGETNDQKGNNNNRNNEKPKDK